MVVITRKGPERDAYPLPSGLIRRQEPRLSSGLERLGWWAFPARLLALRSLLREESVSIAVGVTVLPAVKLRWPAAVCPCDAWCRNATIHRPARRPCHGVGCGVSVTRGRIFILFDVNDRRLVAERHCGANRQLLLPNPVIWPLPSHEPVVAPESLLPEGVPVILAAGTKAHQKGFDRLMPIFATLAQRWPHLRLVLLGLSDQPYQGLRQQTWLRDLLGDDADHQQRLLLPGAVGNMAAWYARPTCSCCHHALRGFRTFCSRKPWQGVPVWRVIVRPVPPI